MFLQNWRLKLILKLILELKLKPIQAVPDKLILEDKDDSEEKFDPGATEAGKEAVVDLEPKNELEKYLLKFRKILAKSVKCALGQMQIQY